MFFYKRCYFLISHCETKKKILPVEKTCASCPNSKSLEVVILQRDIL